MELALPAQGRPTLFVSLPFPNTPNEDVFTTLQGKYPHTPLFQPWKFSLRFIFITNPNHGAFPLSSHLPDVLLLGDDLQAVQSSPGVSWPLPHRILQVLAAPLPFMRTQTGLWIHHTGTKHRPGDLLEPPEPPSVPGAVYSRVWVEFPSRHPLVRCSSESAALSVPPVTGEIKTSPDDSSCPPGEESKGESPTGDSFSRRTASEVVFVVVLGR